MHANIEIDDIQSLILRGFGRLHSAHFLKMSVADAKPGGPGVSLAREGLGDLIDRVSFGRGKNDAREAVNIAFSAPGLLRLGVDDEIVGAFSPEFTSGMHSRAGVLGDDHGAWNWGTKDHVPDAALFLVAESDDRANELRKTIGDLARGWRFEALPQPRVLLGPKAEQDKVASLREHFGFVDGIGNPTIQGLGDGRRPENEIAAGEFLLGYPNETGFHAPSPQVSPGGGRGVVLPNGDFGRNGSYLVFRQLEQNVHAFWSFLLARADGDSQRAIHLAARIVGRWPNGAPLARWSSFEPVGDRKNDDHFLYERDRRGFGCPLGAHIRRANPRDASPMLEPESALASSRRRRLLRRGRAYGEPVTSWPTTTDDAQWPQPLRIVKDGPDETRRGVHFLCFCASLSGQFEFVQQNWINSRKFAGLSNDADPIMANQHSSGGSGSSGFTIQAEPVNERIDGIADFVTTRGGAYLFMPGRRALRYIAGPTSDGGELGSAKATHAYTAS